MSENQIHWFVGIDWAQEKNDTCVLDAESGQRQDKQTPNTPQGLDELCVWLADIADGHLDTMWVAIERPHGPVVETLLDRGFAVFSINPKQLDRFRDRFSPSGAKDDSLDSLVLAHSLMTDAHAYRRLRPDAPETIALREWSRIHSELAAEINELANKTREQLHRYYHQMLQIGDVTEPFVLDLLEKAPTPQMGQRLRRSTIGNILKKHRIRRISSDQVSKILRGPSVTVMPGTVEAASNHVQLLASRLRLALEQRRRSHRQLDKLLDALQDDDSGPNKEQRDVDIIRSFPGLGTVTSAALLAEASQALAQRDYHALRALSGQAPVTRRSGKHKRVLMRRAANPRLRHAMYHACRVAVQVDSHWRAIYAAQRAKGHPHGQALRTVGDRLLAALCAALRAGTLYDPAARKRIAA